jgi:hypothetical protein
MLVHRRNGVAGMGLSLAFTTCAIASAPATSAASPAAFAMLVAVACVGAVARPLRGLARGVGRLPGRCGLGYHERFGFQRGFGRRMLRLARGSIPGFARCGFRCARRAGFRRPRLAPSLATLAFAPRCMVALRRARERRRIGTRRLLARRLGDFAALRLARLRAAVLAAPLAIRPALVAASFTPSFAPLAPIADAVAWPSRSARLPRGRDCRRSRDAGRRRGIRRRNWRRRNSRPSM